MKNEIKYLFIVVTPFHKTVLTLLFPELINNKNTLILISDYVIKDEWSSHVESLTKYEFSRSKLFKHPFKYLNKTKKDITEATQDIAFIKEKYSLKHDLKIYIGTDKDVFTQLLLNDLYKNIKVKKLVVVDEGIGCYINKTIKDQVLWLLYALFTPVIFGVKLYYIKRIGAYPKVDIIYLRAPELLKSKYKNVEYIPFNLNNHLRTPSVIPKGDVLLYSFPDQNYQIQEGVKIKIIKEIASHLTVNERMLIIKPHPRENLEELTESVSSVNNIKLLENNFSGEELDYFDYELIINFFSSIILDIIDRKYPNERVYTIGFTREPEICLGNNLKYCSIHNFSASTFINFDNR